MRHLLLILVAGCADVAEPFELDHPRVMAVRIEPPALASGDTARIELLVTDLDGPRVAPPDDLEITVPFGASVGRDDQGWFVTAGAVETLVALDITVQLAGQPATVQKTFAIGARAENPPRPRIVGQLVEIPPGRDAVFSPEVIDEDLSYRWFSSIGDLKGFTRAEVTLDPIAGAVGAIALVIRDQVGGTAWEIVDATVTP